MVQFVTVVSGTTKLALKRRYVESTSYADALHIASPLCSPNLWPIGLRHSIRPPEPLDRHGMFPQLRRGVDHRRLGIRVPIQETEPFWGPCGCVGGSVVTQRASDVNRFTTGSSLAQAPRASRRVPRGRFYQSRQVEGRPYRSSQCWNRSRRQILRSRGANAGSSCRSARRRRVEHGTSHITLALLRGRIRHKFKQNARIQAGRNMLPRGSRSYLLLTMTDEFRAFLTEHDAEGC